MNRKTKNIIAMILIVLGIIFVIRAFYVKDAALHVESSKSEVSVNPLPGIGIKVSGDADKARVLSLQHEARNYQVGGFILIIAGVAFLMFNGRRR